MINAETQQPLNCNEDNSVTVTCKVANGVQCRGLLNGTRYFQLTVSIFLEKLISLMHIC
ncbi:unnamed protein product [Haemonchus placei]|uniref:Uncharacterized protein n=1 Tax=Haemonchus placei TaxID=6290 RepID=A0A3P7TVB4_HAEPC|nr:unnamed protein product [Haemonchus placei]